MEAGLVDLVCCPSLVTLDRPGGPIWRNRENHVLPLLWPDELPLSRRSSPNVTWDKMLVDAMTMRMVMKPQTLDTTSPPTCIRTSCPTWPPHWLARPSRAYSARYYGPA
jgi:hypothetical protein